jgi:hypothetical protein
MNSAPIRHFDQARQAALHVLEDLVRQQRVERALLSPDIFARIRVALWFADAPSPDQRKELEGRLGAATGPFWGGLWIAAAQTSNADRALLESLWEEGAPHAASVSIRINERHRSLSVWLRPLPGPPWPTDPEADAGGPPILSFYAFKGGAGRSTALAIFAAQRAHAGERVVVVDLDLAAPGVGVLLGDPAVAQAGVVDYWLEQPLLGEHLDLRDYYFRVSQPAVIGSRERSSSSRPEISMRGILLNWRGWISLRQLRGNILWKLCSYIFVTNCTRIGSSSMRVLVSRKPPVLSLGGWRI